MLRVHADVTRALDAELREEHGLPLGSYEVLLFLATSEDGAMRMSQLADGLLLSRSGLTRLVDRLVRDGLVERRPCAEDARGSLAAITARGREAFEAARGTHLAGVRRRFLEHLSEDEQRMLGELFARVLAAQPPAPAS